MPVDIAGWPCDYDAINALVNKNSIKKQFVAESDKQALLGRILVVSDAAHSIGAIYKGIPTGKLTDLTIFSFHAVKNITTAEGGAICLNLPDSFDNLEEYKLMKLYTLNGQNKDALAKMQKGNWKYDIVEPGYKCNMTDIMAAIGLVELARYESEILPRRKAICNLYNQYLSTNPRIELPVQQDLQRESSYHLYPIRIHGISEAQRDEIIRHIFEKDVSVNVHFIPVPMMSYYKNKGYDIQNYPFTYYNFSREISLPVFEDLSDEQAKEVCDALLESINQVLQ
jgi:dTDP-4-amino-4,6-dideoxygalactose transaminase